MYMYSSTVNMALGYIILPVYGVAECIQDTAHPYYMTIN